MGSKKYPLDFEDYVRSIATGRTRREMLQLIQEKYGDIITLERLKIYNKNHDIRSGIPTTYKNGQVPFTKGLKQSDFMSAEAIEKQIKSRFKKGIKPLNTNEVGTLVNKDGYWRRKIAEPNVWVLEHRRVWEEKNGKIPRGYCLIFADGNKDNCSIENLRLILRSELSFLRLDKRSENPEILDAQLNIIRLKRAVAERKHDENR